MDRTGGEASGWFESRRGADSAADRPYVMQYRRQQFWQWVILTIAIAIPLVVGGQALLRLRAASDLVSGVGDGVVVLLCALVLILLAAVFLVAWLCRHCRRNGPA